VTGTGLNNRLATLRKGQRWWAAEVVLRALGLLALVAFWRLAQFVHRLTAALPRHPASLWELALCAASVALLCSGLTLVGVGPGLFRHVPLPPHFTLYPDKKP